MCNGCGCDRNGFAGRVQNHHVRFSFHVQNYFLEIVLENCCWVVTRTGHSALQAAKDAIVGAYHRTIDGNPLYKTCMFPLY